MIEYTKNQTNVNMDTESIVQYIIDLIESNKNILEDIYSMKSVRSGISVPPSYQKQFPVPDAVLNTVVVLN